MMNIEQASRIAELIKKYMSGELSEEENDELESWKRESSENYALFSKLTDQEWIKSRLQSVEGQNNDALWNRILEGINEEAPVVEMKPVRRIAWWKYAAAAVFVGAVSVGVYFVMNKDEKKEVVKVEDQAVRFKNDVAAPVGAKTILTVGDGTQIDLDGAKNGLLTKQGTTSIEKKDGELSYTGAKGTKDNFVLNTLETKRGGSIKLALPDGSLVWLNSASSITYPTVFGGAERKVTLKGEAYFEVAKNPKMPFIVNVNGKEDVRVLGTHFDVMAYEDEVKIKTTLLEGSIQVTAGENKALLKPGQQAELDKAGIKTITNPDIDETLAWKNDWFFFPETDIETIMRQLQRWYDIDVKFEQTIPDKFVAKRIPRTVVLSKLLKYLELTDKVHFKVEGNTVTVMR